MKSPRPRARRRNGGRMFLAASIAAVLALGRGPVGRAVEDAWTAVVSGNWSAGVNWLDGTAPVAPGDTQLALRFMQSSSSAVTATNDLGDSFGINRLILQNNFGGTTTIAGNSIRLTGDAPAIDILGVGSTTISANLIIEPLTGAAMITGAGAGNLTISGIIGSGTPRTIVVAAQPPSFNTQLITLSGANTFVGEVILQSGNLSLGSATALGNASWPLTVKGGNLRFGTTSLTFSKAISLHSDLLITGANSATLSGVISSATGATGLTLRTNTTNSTLTLTAASTYGGATRIDFGPTSSAAFSDAGTIRLSSNGSLLNSSLFDIRANGTLQVDALSTGATNRVSDTAPIELRGGRLSFIATFGTSPQTETLAALSVGGHSVVTVTPVSTVSARLTSSFLSRIGRGTVLFRGTNLGGGFGSNIANVLFSTPPPLVVGGGGTGSLTNIVPYAIGDATSTGLGSGFVTYDGIFGIRVLNTTTEYATTIPQATPNHNVRFTTEVTNDASATVNALVLAGGSLLGSGTLSIISGALLNTANGATITNALDFGSTDGKIFAVGSLAISGPISGSGGLTKSSEGTLTLSAASNPFTGGLTINAGQIAITAASQLGAESSTIILDGQNAGLNFIGSNTLTLTRGFSVENSIARFQSTGGGTLNLAGAISGPGGLRLGGTSGGTLILSGNNSFTGPVFVHTGDLALASDGALGNGGELVLGGGTLRLLASWNTARTIRVTTPSTIDTAGFDTTWTGLLLEAIALTKAGAGTLTIPNPKPYSGAVTVSGGTLRFNGPAPLRSTSFTLNAGGRLLLDKAVAGPSDHLVDDASVTLNGGELAFAGNDGVSVSEKVGSIVLAAGSPGSLVSLSAPGSFGAALLTGSLVTNGAQLLVRGDHLGAAAGGRFTRLAPATSPATIGGLVLDVFAEDPANGIPTTFAVYDNSIDAAGVVGLRPLRASEQTSGASVQNPANGGTTPTTANFVAASGTNTAGANNTVNSLTIENGGSVSLGAGQTLSVASGQVLVRPGVALSTIGGGTLDFGNTAGNLTTYGDLQMSSLVTGDAGWRKKGPGTLTLLTLPANTGGLSVDGGRLRIGSPALFAGHSLAVTAAGILDLNGAPATLGAITGTGAVDLTGETLTLGGLGTDLTIANVFRGPGTVRVVDGGSAQAFRTLAGRLEGNAILSLESGRFQFGGLASTAGSVELNGGLIEQQNTGTLAAPLVLNQSLLLRGNGGLTISGSGGISGAGSIVVQGRGSLTIATRAQHTGETRTAFGLAEPPASVPGNLTVSGAEGALAGTSAVHVGPDTTFTISDTTAFTGAAGGRIADATPVHLRSAALALLGNGTNSTSETIGVLSGAGYSFVAVTPSVSANASLRASELQRIERGTFQFSGSSLGSAPAGNVANIRFTAPPGGMVGGGGTGPNTNILPYAIGALSGTIGFVTYDPLNGIRLLNTTTEYTGSIGAAAATANALVSANESVASPKTINSLRFGISSIISGAGPLTITSGAVLTTTIPGGTIQVPLEFGSAEASFFTLGSLLVSGTISGSGGLTKSGEDNLTLRGSNSFTGPLTINAGTIFFGSVANLGADNSPIVINSDVTSSGLTFSGSGTVVLPRPIQTNSGFAALRTSSSTAVFEVSGPISGSGGVGVTGSGFVTLTGTNSYTGPTIVQGGVAIASDAALGNGGPVEIKDNVAGLKILGPWTTSRRIVLTASSRFSTNGFDAVWLGPLSNTTLLALTKLDAGTLTIPVVQPFDGSISVRGGILRLSDAGRLSSSGYGLNGGTLLLDNGALVINRLPDNTVVSLDGGELILAGNTTSAVLEQIGNLNTTSSDGALSRVTLTAPGAASTILRAAALSNNGRTFFRGDALAGGPGGAFTRVVFDTLPALVNGVVRGALAGSSATGPGASFASYDAASDAAGVIGLRPLRAGEYTSGAEIRNPSNGGTTPVDAHFLASNATAVGGASNTIATLTLDGSSALAMAPDQTLQISTAGILTQAGANATISGGRVNFGGTAAFFHAEGNLTLVSEVTANASLIAKSGGGSLTLNSPLPVEGAVQAFGGALHLGSTGVLRLASVRLVAGTTLTAPPGTVELSSLDNAGTVALGPGTLRVPSLTSSGNITGPSGLVTRSGSLTSAHDFTGPTTIAGTGTSTSTVFTFSGNGSAVASSAISVSGGALRLSNATAIVDRLGPVPMTLNSGRFSLDGGTAGPSSETFPSLTGSGYSVVSSYAGSTGQPVTLSFGAFNRSDRGTFQFVSGFDSSFLPISELTEGGLAKVILPSALAGSLIGAGTTSMNRGILPFATGIGHFITIENDGSVRALGESEYSNTLTTGDNVRLATSTTNNSAVTVNSLALVSPLFGTGAISITSGSLLSATSLTINNSLEFGPQEANIFTHGSTTINGVISGSGGLTKSGRSQLNLTGNNTFTGPITINAGTLSFENLASLGPGTSEIVMGDAVLQYTGGTLTWTRPLRVNGTRASFGNSGAGSLTIQTAITGPGSVSFVGNVILGTAQNFTGDTEITGTLTILSDSALGPSARVVIGGTLKLAGPWTTSRPVTFATSGVRTLDTQGSDATLNGPLSAPSGTPFTKIGAGRLTLNDGREFDGSITVSGGTLALNGTDIASGITVSAASILTGSGSTAGSASISGTLAPGNNVGPLRTGNLSLLNGSAVGSSRVDLQACKLEYSIVSPK